MILEKQCLHQKIMTGHQIMVIVILIVIHLPLCLYDMEEDNIKEVEDATDNEEDELEDIDLEY